MDLKEFDELLHDAEVRMKRLKALYEQWFQGIERTEPAVARKDLERLFVILNREKPRNTAARFRLQQLVARYSTYTTLWGRIARQIEEGTYERDLKKVQRQRGAVTERKAEPKAYEVDLDEDSTSLDLELLDAAKDEIAGALSALDRIVPAAPAPRPALSAFSPFAAKRPAPTAAAPAASMPPAAPGSATPRPPPGAAAPARPAGAVPAPPPAARPTDTAASPQPSAPAARVPAPAAKSATATFGKPASAAGPPAATFAKPTATFGKPPGAVPTRPAAPAAPPRPEPPVVAAPPRPPPPPRPPAPPVPSGARPAPPRAAGGDAKLERLYESYVDARRRNNERLDNLGYDKLAASVQQMRSKLREKHGDRPIDFEVVVQNGRVGIKPKIG